MRRIRGAVSDLKEPYLGSEAFCRYRCTDTMGQYYDYYGERPCAGPTRSRGAKDFVDGDCEGKCGEEVNKRSWHLQCYQSPVLACVKNGACVFVRRRTGRIWGYGGGRGRTGKSCQLDRGSDGEVG